MLLSAGCRKDVAPDPSVQQDATGSLTIGDLSNASLVLSDHDVRVFGPNGIASKSVDVDQDGQQDIRFVIRSYYTMGAGPSGHAYIAAEHAAVGLTGFMGDDSTFVDTATATWSSGSGQYSVEHRTTITRACRPFSDAVLSSVASQRPKLRTYMPAEELQEDASYISDSVRLVLQQGSSMLNYLGVVNDTLYTSQYWYNSNCNTFPNGQLNYTGFRIEQNGTYRLGWIMFTVLEDRWVKIHQVALQND